MNSTGPRTGGADILVCPDVPLPRVVPAVFPASLNLEIHQGKDAHQLLADPDFRADWSRLCEQCPWATPFQSPAFAATWYEIYRDRAQPILILSRDPTAHLQALLPLAHLPARNQLAVAGTWHAEYHAWISTQDLGERFPPAALRAVAHRIPSAGLSFQFLPPGAPINWIADFPHRPRLLLKSFTRPLMRFADGADLAASLAKSGNKSRLRRLEKLGPVQLKRITDAREFDALLDQLIPFYDQRRLAVNGSAPFCNDPLKRAFHQAMFRQPGLLHVTALMAGDRLAAAHLGAIGRREVQLGLIAHNPDLEKHSPGKFLILLLAQALMREGFEQFDLTPGGDPYKERFANAADLVYRLDVFPHRPAKWKAAARNSIEQIGKKTLRALSLTPARVRRFATKLKSFFRPSKTTLATPSPLTESPAPGSPRTTRPTPAP
jgi:CelD/BcsL family acetyltransferase involved in cellulose biosynthesis